MFSKNYECKYLQWDTQYFGVRSARVNLYKVVDKQEQEEIIRFCKDYDFVTISNMGNKAENNYWIGNNTNAFLADINVQFIKILKDKPEYLDDHIYVKHHLPRDKRLIDIARSSFNYSRFYNDPKLPTEKAKNIYAHWTECAFEKENKYFVISERGKNALGFILFSIIDDSCVIELIAVDEKYQGQKVGKSLVKTMELFAFNNGIKKIQVGTQLSNIPAIQFYNVMGFRYENCSSIYHLWKL
jgi:ribosomal protein S18 acetylase RimI-like enzyme